MNKISIFLVLALVFLVGPAWASEVFTPVLAQGDSWLIEVIQKNMFNNEEEWNTPFVLSYTVSKVDGTDYYIDICENEEGLDMGQLVIQKEGFVLKTVYYYRKIQGDLQKFQLDFDNKAKAPVISEISFMPYSLPVFPLEKGRGGDLMESVPQKDSFHNFKTLSDSDFKFKRNFSQQTVDSTVLATLESEEALELIEELGEESLLDGYYVTIRDSFFGEKVEQLWKKGYPWFLYSRNKSVKAKLIQHSSANGGDK